MRRLLIGLFLAVPLTVGWDTVAWPQAHYQSCHVVSGTPRVCRVGAGVLYAVTINTKGASGNYTYLFDSGTFGYGGASGQPLLSIDTTAGPLTLQYNIMVTNGVSVYSANGTFPDLTIVTD